MTTFRRFTYTNKNITAQKADEIDNFLWLAFAQGDDGKCVIKKCAFGYPTQVYYSLNREVTEINELDLDVDNLYVAYNDATYLGEIISKSNPLTTTVPISRGVIEEAPIDVKVSDDYVWFLLPGNASGTNAKLLKYDTSGVLQQTVDLSKSGEIVYNAKSMVIPENEEAGVANDVNTDLLIHANGEDGSDVFEDSSSSGHIITAVNDAQIDIEQRKYGNGSALFDGSDYLSVAYDSVWNLGTVFTLDTWVRFSSLSGNQALMSRFSSGTSYLYWALESGGVKFRDYNGANIVNHDFGTPSLSIDTWYHFAIVRDGDNYKFFIDGTQFGSTLSDASALTTRSEALEIGGSSGLSGYGLTGWMDDVRVSNGTARWSTTFTPPIALSNDIWISTYTDPAKIVRVHEISNDVYDFDVTEII